MDNKLLTRLSAVMHSGRKQIILEPKPDPDRHRRARLGAWVKEPAARDFLADLKRQQKTHKNQRMDAYNDHLAMVAHSAWESALDWVIELMDHYGQAASGNGPASAPHEERE